MGDAEAEIGGDGLLTEVMRSLHELSMTVGRLTREVIEDLGMNETAAAVLWMLDPAEPPVAMRGLARRIGCDPSNISLVSARLEKTGLVERRANRDDARSKVLTLTEHGRAVRAQLVDHVQRSVRVGELTTDEQRELMRLIGVLSPPRSPSTAT